MGHTVLIATPLLQHGKSMADKRAVIVCIVPELTTVVL